VIKYHLKKINMRIKYISLAFALFALSACSKKMDLQPLSFDVQADKATYNVGEAVSFKFSGKPHVITFYSGEPGGRYDYKDRTQATGIAQLKFSTARNAGTQLNSLQLLVSTDFKGEVTSTSDAAALSSATWTDISNRATWATTSTTVASGTVNLSDFAATGRPVYIAFKYNAAAGNIQNKWTITGFSIDNVLPDGTTYNIGNLPTVALATNYGASSALPGWGAKTVSNTFNWVLSATNLVITGAATATLATAPAEAWAITGPVDLKKVTPDAGVVVQNTASFVPSFSYKYTKAGTYQVLFKATNANADSQNSIEKKMNIVVQ
jgi:hypothetical protein